MACHLLVDADPDPAYRFDMDPDLDLTCLFDADLDPQNFIWRLFFRWGNGAAPGVGAQLATALQLDSS